MPLPILGLLKFAPAIFSAGQSIVSAFTGVEPPENDTPEDLAARIQALPPEQQAETVVKLEALKVEIQRLDTERFVYMNEGDAEKIRATARPEIARRAMGVIEIFSRAVMWLFVATIVEWLVRTGYAFTGNAYPETLSLWELIAKAGPVIEMIWAPLLGSFWVCAEVIKKYMGCRERDKAHEFEIRAGRELNSTKATVAAAGGFAASVIRAVRGKS